MNRTALAVLCLSLLGSPLHAKKAAEPPKKPAAAPSKKKIATIGNLIATTMRSGNPWTLKNPRAQNLGYMTEMGAKKLVLGKIADGAELSSIVILSTSGHAAAELVFSITRAEYSDSKPVSIDGFSFRADLKGRLLSGIRAYGPATGVAHDALDVASPKVKTDFDNTVTSFLNYPAVPTQ